MIDSRTPRIFQGVCLGGPLAGNFLSASSEKYFTRTSPVGTEHASPVFADPDTPFDPVGTVVQYRHVEVTLPDRSCVGLWAFDGVDPNKAIRAALASALSGDAIRVRGSCIDRLRRAIRELSRLASGDFRVTQDVLKEVNLLAADVTRDFTL